MFSIAITACAAKFVNQLHLLFGEGPYFLAKDRDGADQLAFLEHRHVDDGAGAGEVGDRDHGRVALEIGRLCPKVCGLHHAPVRDKRARARASDEDANGLNNSLLEYAGGML